MDGKRQLGGITVAAASAALLFALLSTLSRSAAAATPRAAPTDAEKAEALIREGVQMRAHDKTPLALPLFEQAYEISRTPRTAAQLGLCELELGYFAAAERYLGEALAAPDHPWVSRNKPALKKALETARASVGELALVLAPAGADVLLNHKPIDKALLAAPLRLDKGPVDVEVRAPGYEPARDTVIIVGGKQEQRTYTLVKEATAPVAAGIWPGAPAAGAAPAPGATLTSTDAAPAPRKPARIAAWATGAAGAAALVFGTVEAFNAAGKRDTFNDHTTVVGGVAYHDCGTAKLSPACKSIKDDYDSALTLTIVGFAAAGALAATSSVLFVLSSSGHGTAGEHDGATRAFGCVPDPIARGLGCSLRF